jgi:hypothetical protein
MAGRLGTLSPAKKCGMQKAHMASIGFSLNNFFINMNLFRFVYSYTFQRRSGAVRHVADSAASGSAEHDSVRRHIAPVR